MKTWEKGLVVAYVKIKDARAIRSVVDRFARDVKYGKYVEIVMNLRNFNHNIEANPYYRTCIATLADKLNYTKEEMNDIVLNIFLRQSVLIGGVESFTYKRYMPMHEIKSFLNELQIWAKSFGVFLPEPDKESIFEFHPV